MATLFPCCCNEDFILNNGQFDYPLNGCPFPSFTLKKTFKVDHSRELAMAALDLCCPITVATNHMWLSTFKLFKIK